SSPSPFRIVSSTQVLVVRTVAGQYFEAIITCSSKGMPMPAAREMAGLQGLSSRGVVSIGECMVESRDRPDRLSRAFGGDTLNTAVYLARLGGPVGYLTSLGVDPYSAEMLAAWQAEGVICDDVAILPGKLPGLYAIRVDGGGERSFFYWRGAAAAREMMKDAAGD